MDTNRPTPRSPAQIAASRVNGAMSSGPATAEGKAVASANGVVHGLAARALLLAGERVEDYQAVLDPWVASLRPRSLAEAQVVARIADVAFRQERLSRLEERLVASEVEKQLGASEPAKKRQAVQHALEGMQGLRVLAESVVRAVDREKVEKLVPAMQVVKKLVAAADVAVAPAAALDLALGALQSDAVTDVEPAVFAALATACRQVEVNLTERLVNLEKAVETEREHLVELVVLGEHEHAKLLDRHRARLQRELQAHLAALRTLREVAVPECGTLVAPCVVQVRLAGRHELAPGR